MVAVDPSSAAAQRPPVWIGHVGPLVVADLSESIAFYERLGLRPGFHHDGMASMELRGGTHLVLVEDTDVAPGHEAPFDLMVDDLPQTQKRLAAASIGSTPIERSGAHERFWITDPSGHRIRVHDSHVVGVV